MDASGDAGNKRRRRGPYKKKVLPLDSTFTENLITEHVIKENIEHTERAGCSSSFQSKSDNLSHEGSNLEEPPTSNLEEKQYAECILEEIVTVLEQSNEEVINEELYIPVQNDSFDIQFDALIESVQEEYKDRNNDILVNDTQEDVGKDIEEEDVEYTQSFVEEIDETNFPTTFTENANEKAKPDEGSKKLYNESPYTLGVTVLLICTFLIRFRLPDEAAVYMLRIFACILPVGHRLMGTIYHLRKFLRQYTSDLLPKIYYHCNFCYTEVNRTTKECHSCHKSLTSSGSMAYFVQLKIASQLASLWKNPEFEKSVRTNRFKHYANKKIKGSISDVYDGKMYRKLFNDNGILKDPNNLSFALNTDGVPLFKSSNVGFWPVYLLINELPITMRKRRDFSIFYGAWISARKPQMWSFLKPLYEELKTLETEGHQCTTSSDERFCCKCVLLTCTCDLPARALVYNNFQYNGQYSCWFCLERGESYKFDTGGSCHVYPFKPESPKNIPRTRDTVLSDIRDVCSNINNNVRQYMVRGHKGPFWFMYLHNFDLINSCVIDYMHGVCLGVMKTLLVSWFDKSKKNEKFSFFNSRDKVNSLLKTIKPSVFVTRVPRSLDELCHWKSSEFRNFLLYWGVPVLRNVLDRDFFSHFCLLARSIFLLSKETITENDLHIAEGALILFVECFEKLYGLRYCTLNLHQLVHLVDCVRQTGPLYINNCFIFEDLNGYFVKHIHGTQGVDMQLVNLISMLKVTPLLYEKYLKDTENGEAIQIYLELNDSVHARHTHHDDIENGICPIGTFDWKQLNIEEQNMLSIFGVKSAKVKKYVKVNMYKLGFYVYGKEYKRLIKRQQNIATYHGKDGLEFCAVNYFVQSSENLKDINLAFVTPFKKEIAIGSIWQVTALEEQDVFIPISDIININNIVHVNEVSYICPAPNRYDRD